MDKRPIKHMLLSLLSIAIMIIALIYAKALPLGSVSTEIRRMSIVILWCTTYVGLLSMIYKLK